MRKPTRLSAAAVRSAISRRPTPASRKPSPTTSRTRIRGLSEEVGSWKIMPTPRLAAGTVMPRDTSTKVRSPRYTAPLSGFSRPTTMRPIVVLPDPDSPTMARISDGWTSIEMSFNAAVRYAGLNRPAGVTNTLPSPLTRSAGGGPWRRRSAGSGQRIETSDALR